MSEGVIVSLKDIRLKDTYWSGEDSLIDEFYIPCLNESTQYDRAVGFFNSSILKYIVRGITGIVKNSGKIRLICGVQLSDNDQQQISEGYDLRKKIEERLHFEAEKLLVDKNDPSAMNLCWLIKNEILDLKICVKDPTDSDILFHEKFGVFHDKEENTVSFIGSINESGRGWLYNEESFEVSYNWIDALRKRVEDKVLRFEKLWEGTAPNVTTYDFPDAVRQMMIQAAPREMIMERPKKDEHFEPRKCQKAAKDKFISSDYICLYEMATGSGKTKAALFSLKEIEQWKVLIIFVPNLDLVDQWEKDVVTFYPDAYRIKCGSNFAGWKELFSLAVQARFPQRTIIITTYQSAVKDFFIGQMSRINPKHAAGIFDEVHNVGSKEYSKILDFRPEYRIGLSATPERNFDDEGTKTILTYFNNNEYQFTIKDAIREEYLVEYEYYVTPYYLTDLEWAEYKTFTQKINRMMHYKKEEDENESLKMLLMKRSDILKTAEGKEAPFETIISQLDPQHRVLVYGESKEHIAIYGDILRSLSKDYYTYIGDVDSKKARPIMLKHFEIGIKKILLAIDCLDEGVDLPKCDAAIFLSSSTSDRQYIQRRGRVLRKRIGKTRAYVYDFLTIPPFNHRDEEERKMAENLVIKEFRRIEMVADDAINGSSVMNKLENTLDHYDLNIYKF